MPKTLKKEELIKLEKKLKLEYNVKIKLITIKWLRIFFFEILPPKRFYICIKREVKVIEDLDNCLKKRDDKFLVIKVVFKVTIDSQDKDLIEI